MSTHNIRFPAEIRKMSIDCYGLAKQHFQAHADNAGPDQTGDVQSGPVHQHSPKGRAVEIPCPTCPISLRTSKKFQFTCPGTSTS